MEKLNIPDNMKIVIINGSGGVGKDTFVDLMKQFVENSRSSIFIHNISTVDQVKQALKLLGWEEVVKTEEDRNNMSIMKNISVKSYDGVFKYVYDYVKSVCDIYNRMDDYSKLYRHTIIFIHCREPEEIKRLCNEFNAYSLLVCNNRVKHITSNPSDENVYKYNYDFVLHNNGSVEDLSTSTAGMLSLIIDDQHLNRRYRGTMNYREMIVEDGYIRISDKTIDKNFDYLNN